MNRCTQYLFALLIAILLLISPRAHADENIAYAIAEKGKIPGWHLSMNSSEPFHADKVTHALCSNEEIYPVQLTGKNIKESCERSTAGNYCNGKGKAFHIKTEEKNLSCFLLPKPFASKVKVLPMTSVKNSECPKDLVERIQKQKQRQVKQCWLKKSLGKSDYLGFVVFQDSAKDRLASLFSTISKKESFQDHKAYLGYGWRAGAGLDFEPNDFSFLIAFQDKKSSKIGLGFIWGGEEGSNIYLLQQSGTQLIEVFREYDYHYN